MWKFVIEHWAEMLFTLVSASIAALYRRLSDRVKKEVEEQQLLKEGVLAILHDRLYQQCRDFISYGAIDVEGLKNIEYLYESYHALGGNGTGTELFERVRRLPIKEE